MKNPEGMECRRPAAEAVETAEAVGGTAAREEEAHRLCGNDMEEPDALLILPFRVHSTLRSIELKVVRVSVSAGSQERNFFFKSSQGAKSVTSTAPMR